MEQFITEVGLTSVSEPNETNHLLKETVDMLMDGVNQVLFIDYDDEDEESSWIYFGVGGPA
jgi:hypothetical protein